MEWLNFHHRAKTINYHHNMYTLLKQTEYGQTHPEYFSEVNGRRRVFTKNVSSAWQACMTHPDGIRVVAEEIIRRFDADPTLLSVSIASNDGGNMLAETRQAMLLARLASSPGIGDGPQMPARTALEMATLGSARLLGRTDIGSLEAGKGADFFTLDLNRVEFAALLRKTGSNSADLIQPGILP